jgi:hypothetical protein
METLILTTDGLDVAAIVTQLSSLTGQHIVNIYDGFSDANFFLINSLDTEIKKICYTQKMTITVLTFYDGILLNHHCPMRVPCTPSKPCFLFPYKPNSNPHLAFVIALTSRFPRSVQY